MKLLFCRKCQDVFKLAADYERTCKCGAVGGKYLEDGWHAVYWGVDAVPIGFANGTLGEAIRNQPIKGDGKRFQAFVIPKQCPTFKRLKQTDDIHVGKK